MRNHLHLWQGIHIVTNPATDGLAYMLHVIKTQNDAIIINAKEKGAPQAVGEGTHAFQPTLRFLLFKHDLEVVRSTFCYQTI